MPARSLLAAAGLVLALAAPASAHPGSLGSCSPDVALESFSDTVVLEVPGLGP